MSKRITIAVTPPVLLPNNLVHYGTEYKVSKSILFNTEDLLVNEISTIDLYEKKFTLEITNEDTFYVVTRYQYITVDENGDPVLDENNQPIYKMGTPSMVTPFKGDQEGIKISDTIIKTPIVNFTVTHDYSIDGNILLTTSDFEMFSGIGVHESTTWVVKDVNNNIKYIREKDVDNLTSIVLPVNFKINDNLTFYAVHHSDTNADSNYGMKINMYSSKLPKYNVEMYGDLYVGVEAQFRINLTNYLYNSITLEVSENNLVINNFDLTSETVIVDTSTYTVGNIYTFKFTIMSSNDIESTYTITKEAKEYTSKFESKSYLDVYDYGGLLITNGLTTTLSYQLDNGAILLCKNNSKEISLAKYKDGNIHFIGDLLTLPLENNILEPATFVRELLNSNVIISYISNDLVSMGDTFIDVYEHNQFTNAFTLINSSQVSANEKLIMPGSITIVGNYVYFIQYGIGVPNKLVRLDPYTSLETHYDLPFSAKRGISISSDNTGNIYILGGTDDDLSDYSILHTRSNDKVYRFNTNSESYVEMGTDLLSTIDGYIYQFHTIFRLDGNFILFNNIDNNNTSVIADQSSYLMNLTDLTVTYLNNDHLGGLPYGNTVVLKTGDFIRYSSITNETQKVYTYISNTMLLTDINDGDTLSYDPTNVSVADGESIAKTNICRYDSINIEGTGQLSIITKKEILEVGSDTLVITRDTVMDESDFIANNYGRIAFCCNNITLVLK